MLGGTTRNTANFLIIDLTEDDGVVVDTVGWLTADVVTIIYWHEPD